MLYYLPLVFGLIFAITGVFIVGWEKHATSNKVTLHGWLTIFMSIVCFTLSAYILYNRNSELKQVKDIRKRTNIRLITAVNYMVRDHVKASSNNLEVFKSLRDSFTINQMSRAVLISASPYTLKGLNTDYKHQYELISANIQSGVNIMNEINNTYKYILEPEIADCLHDVLDDRYLHKKYNLSAYKHDLDTLANLYAQTKPSQLSPEYFLGYYYFDYLNNTAIRNSPNYNDYLTFIKKLEKLVKCIEKRHKKDAIIFVK